jgi:hypothetical protein
VEIFGRIESLKVGRFLSHLVLKERGTNDLELLIIFDEGLVPEHQNLSALDRLRFIMLLSLAREALDRSLEVRVITTEENSAIINILEIFAPTGP